MSIEEILSNVDLLQASPIAFEAQWDGDTDGWYIYFNAITEDNQPHSLGVVTGGGDIRLFNGQIPLSSNGQSRLWPEAVAAAALGAELAKRFDAEFYFPSPEYPEDECPLWNERSQGYPCKRCGILLLQKDPCPWRGTCYSCHRIEEEEARVAGWTPEQRAGKRCRLCGNPANKELNGGPACEECFVSYEVYACEKCNGVTTILKSIAHTALCHRCELQNAVEKLSQVQIDAIRLAMTKGKICGIESVMDTVGCSLNDARRIVDILSVEDGSDSTS